MTDVPRSRSRFPILPAAKLVGLVLLGLLIFSCSGPSVKSDRQHGVYHRVKSGETLSAIARAYQVNLQDLAEINNIDRPNQIETGSVIFIPDASQIVDDVLAASRVQKVPAGETAGEVPAVKTKPPAPAEPSRKAAPKKETVAEAEKRRQREAARAAAKDRAALARAADRDKASRRGADGAERGEKEDRSSVKGREDEGKAGEIRFDRKRFIWPVKGKVVGKFGSESVTSDYNGRKIETARIMNNGIKIAADVGTPVRAAADGRVIYSMKLEKFGNTIIIEHADDFKTVYYDLGRRLVETTRVVKKGEPIGHIAEGTSKSDAYMTFEIRQNNKPRNPLFFLP